MAVPSVVILGLGWVGEPLAKALIARDCVVTGTVRTSEQMLAWQSVCPSVDVVCWQSGQPLPAAVQANTTVIITLPPHKVGADYQAQMVALVQQCADRGIAQLIYLSSTSVYGRALGACTEETIPEPETPQAQALLAVEQACLQAAIPCITVLRLAGLIGPKRYPGRFLSNKPLAGGGRCVNLVHQSDVVALLVAQIFQPESGIFNLVAPDHPTRAAFYQQACQLAGLALPQITDLQDDGRRVSGHKLEQVMHYRYQVADLMAWLITASGDV